MTKARRHPKFKTKPVRPKRLAITTGDRDGIGLEVAVKALSKIGPQSSTRFVVVCSTSAAATKELKRLKKFRRVELSHQDLSLAAAIVLLSDLKKNEILVWRDSGNEAGWVESCAELALKNKIDGLVTGPVSKARFESLTLRRKTKTSPRRGALLGHTGLLSAMTKTPVQQGYVGPKMSVVLATDHVPLSRVEKSLNAKRVLKSLGFAKELQKLLPAARSKKPIALLGLNPHAGEDGLIGRFESHIKNGLKDHSKLFRSVVGPLPADTAFTPESLEKFSVYIALYHDQGLIPFKTLHGQDSGFQISLGLPFVRTSVDHGTAKDIFGRNRANPGSMIDAIKGAISGAIGGAMNGAVAAAKTKGKP